MDYKFLTAKFKAVGAAVALSVGFAAATLGGCVSNVGAGVQDITHVTLPDGGTQITITYSDISLPPAVFTIPRGEQGERGNGIADVSAQLQSDGSTLVTISYTDGECAPTAFTLPSGAGIVSAESAVNSEGDTVVSLYFSDDMPPCTFVVPSGRDGKDGEDGKDGKDGSSISAITSHTDPDSGEVTVTIAYDDGGEHTFQLNSPKGEDGRGISDISVNPVTSSDPDFYHLDIAYSDGDMQQLLLPKAPIWHNGEGAPSLSFGAVGDYYVDALSASIYVKSDDGWQVLMDFSAYSAQRHSVRLVVDGLTYDVYTVRHGSNFYSSGITLPTPFRSGYKFLGWYTEEELSPVSGRFDSLTYVLSDMVLYAQWQMQ